MKSLFKATALALALAGAGVAGTAHAGAVITSGNGLVTIGVKDNGELGFGSVGINYQGVGDAIIPGCLCEGWGLSGNGIAGWAGNANGGTVNVTHGSFSSTATSATSTISLTSLPGLTMTQAYGGSASGGLFRNHVTITNTSGATISDIRYSRSMDWDIPPTTFSEMVTIGGLPATAVLFSNDNGFATPDPLTNPSQQCGGSLTNTNFTDQGPCDHGAFFTFGFGDLAAGATREFDIFYGAAASESAAFAALAAVGAEVYSFGQNSRDFTGGTPATYIFAFAGVGGTPIGTVPEPLTLGMFGAGLLGLAALRRRKSV